MSVNDSNSGNNSEAPSHLYFVTCFLDESVGNRDSDYSKLGELLKSKSIDEMLRSVRGLSQTLKEPYGKGTLAENQINGFALGKHCWFVKFEGEANHLRVFIEKEIATIKQNDILIVTEVKSQNIAMQYSNEREFHQWNC